MIRVKVCGITNLSDAKAAEKYGAHALGFVFYRKSPRCISPEKVKVIIRRLSPFINSVGVFVNEKESTVKRIAKFCKLDVLQFHGDETPGYCAKFKNYKVIKAFRVKNKQDLKKIKKYKVDAVLMDTFSKDRFGGSGETFDWRIIRNLKLNIPIILSGGLNPKNISRAIKSTCLSMADVSSGVEKTPVKKDHYLIQQFMDRISRPCV